MCCVILHSDLRELTSATESTMVCRCPKFRCTSGQVDNVSVSRASFPPQESNVSRLNMIVKRQENA